MLVDKAGVEIKTTITIKEVIHLIKKAKVKAISSIRNKGRLLTLKNKLMIKVTIITKVEEQRKRSIPNSKIMEEEATLEVVVKEKLSL